MNHAAMRLSGDVYDMSLDVRVLDQEGLSAVNVPRDGFYVADDDCYGHAQKV